MPAPHPQGLDVVYWIAPEAGQAKSSTPHVFHLCPDVSPLRGKTVNSGSVTEAENATRITKQIPMEQRQCGLPRHKSPIFTIFTHGNIARRLRCEVPEVREERVSRYHAPFVRSDDLKEPPPPSHTRSPVGQRIFESGSRAQKSARSPGPSAFSRDETPGALAGRPKSPDQIVCRFTAQGFWSLPCPIS